VRLCIAGLCEHKWREHVEGWCTSGLVLASTLPDTSHDMWARLVSTRGDGWFLAQQDTCLLYKSFKALHLKIVHCRTCSDGDVLRQHLQQQHTFADHSIAMSVMLAHLSKVYPTVRQILFFEHLLCWATFIKDYRFEAKYSPAYGLGIASQYFIQASTSFSVGPLVTVYIGSRSYEVLLPGSRRSAIHNNFVMGPLSLLNREHCNVDCTYENEDVLVLRDVKVGTMLLTEYADENYVKEKFNLQCLHCFEGHYAYYYCTSVHINVDNVILIIFLILTGLPNRSDVVVLDEDNDVDVNEMGNSNGKVNVKFGVNDVDNDIVVKVVDNVNVVNDVDDVKSNGDDVDMDLNERDDNNDSDGINRSGWTKASTNFKVPGIFFFVKSIL